MIPPASLLLELASKGLFWRFCYLWGSTSLRVGPLTGKTHSKKLAVDQCILVPSCSLCFFDSSTHSNQCHVRVCIRWLRSQIFPQLDSFKEESLSLGFRKLKMQYCSGCQNWWKRFGVHLLEYGWDVVKGRDISVTSGVHNYLADFTPLVFHGLTVSSQSLDFLSGIQEGQDTLSLVCSR